MPDVVACPACQRQLRVPDSLIDKLVKCPTCGETFTASAEAPAPPPPAPVAAERQERAPARSRSGSRYELQDEDDEPRPRRRSRPRYEDDEDDEDDDDYGRRRRYRPGERPAKVQAIGIMTLIGGILAILGSLGWFAYIGLMGVATFGIGLLCCLWPGPYYGLVMGILATIKGSQLLGRHAQRLPPPKAIAIMQIVNIVNLDVVNCTMGIVTLVFLNEREVERYFRG